MLGRALGVVLAAAALGRAAPAQNAADRMASSQCERCHADREQLARRAPPGWNADSLFVSRGVLAGTVHASVPCVRCHPIPGLAMHPGEARTTVPCGTCHATEDSLWRAGPHGGRSGLKEASCTACHGVHEVRPARELESGDVIRLGSERLTFYLFGAPAPS